MTSLDSFILGAVQGVTEFLPISSSGHLIIFEEVLNLPVEHLKSFDVTVHVATLLAIMIYFWKDIKGLILALPDFILGRWQSPYAKLISLIIIATIPAVIVGAFFGEQIDAVFRDPKSIAIWFIFIGLFFILGEYIFKISKNKENEVKKWHQALVIGIAQAFALIPGISRSGSTIVTGLFLGINREKAARFSFLIGVPAIAGAGLLTALSPSETPEIIQFSQLAVGFLSSFIFSLITVWGLMKFIKKHSFAWFSIYLFIAAFCILFEIL
ncbi:undecaprenyl-diphosphatase UppP [Candidatus Peregrinibacteria bacterium HGW-Peregrinibacteria-1]|jgi:undecaprenyl-diphosphatase|nr:MAG: undecaprenyl-diphosphatase UppP [Candidatus Peregrinibacteria bacterium HGW-Peregrinibacteria-1]